VKYLDRHYFDQIAVAASNTQVQIFYYFVIAKFSNVNAIINESGFMIFFLINILIFFCLYGKYTFIM
jgi:hypothetical protein